MRNKIIQTFDIHLLSIKKDVEVIKYQIDETFFKSFEQDIVLNGKLVVIAEVIKTHAMITINLEVTGTVELVCDRSLEKFDYPIHIEDSLFYKFGVENLEIDINLYQIENNTNKLNIADDLMEFILIEIPYRKIHPKFEDEDEEGSNGPYYQTQIEEKEIEEKIDPRWEGLKKFKK